MWMQTRGSVPRAIARLLVAALLAAGVTALAERAGPIPTTILLFALLVAALYVVTLLISSALANPPAHIRLGGGRRGPRWRWPFWPFRRNGGNGRGLGGMREPRRPRPPFFPPRAAAAEPDTVAHER